MAGKNLSAIIQIGGTVSSSFRGALSSTATNIRKIGSAIQELKAKQKGLSADMNIAGSAGDTAKVKALTAEYDRLGVSIGKLAAKSKALNSIRGKQDQNLANRAKFRSQLLDAVALGATVAVPVKVAADFEFNLAQIGVIGDLTADQLSVVRKSIESVSKATVQSRTDVTKAFSTLVSAGLDTERALAVLPVIGKTATAATADIEDMSKATFTLLSALKIAPSELPRAMDMMAQAGKEGNFELKDMAQHLPKIGAFAESLHMSGPRAVASLSAALQIARRGAGDASAAATNLENFLAKITSEETRKRFKKMGVSIEDEFNQAVKDGKDPLVEMIFLIEKMTKGDKFRVGDLFGDMEVLQFLSPALANLNDFAKIRGNALKASGVVDRDFARMSETATKNFERLSGSMTRLGSAIGDKLIPAILPVINFATRAIEKIGALADRFPILTNVVVIAGGAIATIGASVIGLGYAFTFVRGAMLGIEGMLVAFGIQSVGAGGLIAGLGRVLIGFATTAIPVVIGAVRALSVALMTNPIGLVIGLIAIAAGLLIVYWKPISAFFVKLWGTVKDAVMKFWDWYKTTIFWRASPLRMIIENWGPIKDYFRNLWAGIKEVWSIARVWLRAWWNWSPLGLIANNWGPISSAFGKIWEGIKAVWGAARPWLVALWNWSPLGLIVNNWGRIQPYLSALWDGIKAVTSAAWDFLKAGFEWTPLGMVMKAWEPVKDYFIALWDSIKKPFEETFGSIENKIALVGSVIKNLGKFIGDLAPGATPSAGDEIPGFDGNIPLAGARARGGPVSSGNSYLVGERGPEIFTPGRSGGIVPNGAIGGVTNNNSMGGVNVNITVNAAKGQDAVSIAEQVYRIIKQRTAAAGRSALFDGATYA